MKQIPHLYIEGVTDKDRVSMTFNVFNSGYQSLTDCLILTYTRFYLQFDELT